MRLDGEAPGAAHVDIDEDGNGVLDEGRLYQLVREADAPAGLSVYGVAVAGVIFIERAMARFAKTLVSVRSPTRVIGPATVAAVAER